MKYIDTSAFVKYYGNPEFEKGIEVITNLLENAKKGEEILTTSIFTIGETISAFDRWVRMRAITKEELDKIITRFFTDIEELTETNGLIIEDIDAQSIISSIEHILKYNIPINDAIHLHTALHISPKIESFISSDKQLNKAVQDEGLEVFDPEE